MTFDEILDSMVAQGAIRVYRVSEVWALAYRVKDGEVQARGLNQIDGQWQAGDRLVSSRTFFQKDGWYAVEGIPKPAKPIELEAAKGNPGYYDGLQMRQCQTCRQYKPLTAFERPIPDEQSGRTWECNQCYATYIGEIEAYQQDPHKHVGDYLRRSTHAARPPAEGEI